MCDLTSLSSLDEASAESQLTVVNYGTKCRISIAHFRVLGRSSVQASPESGCECSSWFVLRPSNGRSQKSKSGQSVLVVSHL
jgi:hypothetical protein